MVVRGKFRVTGHEITYSGMKVTLTPQYDPKSVPEDIAFNKATPQGKIEMVIDNPPAFGQFTLGDYFYVDFTKCRSEFPEPA